MALFFSTTFLLLVSLTGPLAVEQRSLPVVAAGQCHSDRLGPQSPISVPLCRIAGHIFIGSVHDNVGRREEPLQLCLLKLCLSFQVAGGYSLNFSLIWRLQVSASAGPGHSVLSDRTHPSHATSFLPGLPPRRYHHPSHTGMSPCLDERSTTETESIDKSVDSFQGAIRCAETKTKCNTRFKLIHHLSGLR